MDETLTVSCPIDTANCDHNSMWRPGMMLVAMQEIASAQCDRLGVGMMDLLPKNLVWVVTAWK